MSDVDLSKYDNSDYYPGAGFPKRLLWYFCNAVFMHSWLPTGSKIKVTLLRVFGATAGKNITIKHRVNIKYPWFLSIGDNVWIGEECWIDNLSQVTIGSNVCLSQGAYLLTGNHDYKDPAFGLQVKSITIDDGVWVGAKAIVCPGLTLKKYSVLTVGSILTRDTEKSGIYQGNPAALVKKRIIDK